ncbi:MAG: HIT domain-containing protein [Glaciecola sp.]|jgi:diadenosine tetraphosphate (Ap4A) HIT family hydrolase|nr:HIT domain-containing protein [Glaciecola sp.]MDG1814664.1 HIT domain-containing protein [Glaciecola sp.]MDG2100270.1 HIT domain-containing protein [Glaciecola sp.]
MFNLDERLQNDTYFVANLPISQLLLMNDKQYPWFILVPRIADISETCQLSASKQVGVLAESNALSQALLDLYVPTTLNVAALGNVVRQLHIHHIARFEHDKAWPMPIWGHSPSVAYSDTEAQLLINQILAHAKIKELL